MSSNAAPFRDRTALDQQQKLLRSAREPFVSLKYKAGIALLQKNHRRMEVLLVLQSNGQWSLPKGKRKRGETLRQSGQRECREETGRQPEALQFVGWGANTRKRVRFYLWKSEVHRSQPAQRDIRQNPEILQTAWVDLADAPQMLKSWQASLLAKIGS